MQEIPFPTPRLFVEQRIVPGARIDLPEAAAHHVARVLRLRAGDSCVLFDGSGGEYTARIAAIGRGGVGAEVLEFSAVERESPLHVTLLQGLSARDRMDLTVQKSAELGMAAIQPTASEKSVAKLKGERSESRVEHWRRVAIAACEQCGRNRIPLIHAPLPLASYRAPAETLKLLLAPGARLRLREVGISADRPIVLAVGPEAGFGASEDAALIAAGFVPIWFGPRLLRTETAGPAALAALNAFFGDM